MCESDVYVRYPMNDTIVTTNGCFDILHAGHMEMLRVARRMGDLLVVGLNSDDSVRRLKGDGHPLVPQEYRRALLESVRYVDRVYIFEEDDPTEFLRLVRPDIHVKSEEYEFLDIPEKKLSKELGFDLRFVPRYHGLSTTKILCNGLRAIRRYGVDTRSKIYNLPEDILPVLQKCRDEYPSRIVTLNGSFEILHRGHLNFLRTAANAGDILIVSVNCDDYIRNTKGREPHSDIDSRMEVVAALDYVNYVVPQNYTSASHIIEIIRPDIHCIGSEYLGAIAEQEMIDRVGSEVLIIDRVPGYSSSDIMKNRQPSL